MNPQEILDNLQPDLAIVLIQTVGTGRSAGIVACDSN
jgi:hypothetical protein